MATRVTIVMYHFVRDLARSRYPRIKGLDLAAFRGQLAYLQRHYAIVGMAEVMAAFGPERQPLPPRAALLTFDDGYIDHFTNVFPLLDELRIQGAFFPPAGAILENRVLDVNKIHFVLAAASNPDDIAAFLVDRLEAARDRYDLPATADLAARYAGASRYDPPQVTFIKRVLQRDLPEELRGRLVADLFERFVTTDEAAFSRELYVSLDQLRCMHRAGMCIGSHGYEHLWLDAQPPERQASEIARSLDFLRLVGVDTTQWVMCYPYGGYDEGLVRLLRGKGCRLGLATRVAIADAASDDPLALPRLDTNDLPRERNADASDWTLEAEARL